MMKYTINFACLLVFIMGCKPSEHLHQKDNVRPYPTVSYLDIELDSTGGLPSNPYIVKFEQGAKTVVFCGVNHLTDDSNIEHPMFKAIEKAFFDFKPEVAINEGGDISKKQYKSKRDALLQDGEIGLTKVLCDSLKIQPVDGDPSAAYEFQALLRTYSKGELLAYIITERLMWGLKGQGLKDNTAIEKIYTNFVQKYIMGKGGIQLSTQEQTFDFYKANYKTLLNRDFDINELEPTNPFEPEGKFQAIGRRSKEIRDQYLIQTVDNLLKTHDKVFIVFGGWHLLTCRPGIEAVVKHK